MTQYFDEQPRVGSETTVVDVALTDVAFTMVTDRGVFSHGRLDTGTGLLLREAPAPSPAGDLVDVGCGSGAIAITMALRAPATTVWAVDVNDRARHLTALNAARNGIDNIRVIAPHEVPADLRPTTIWSNPPIRIGKPALHELLMDWLGRLAPGGGAVLVVQKHLGADSLQNWLQQRGYRADRIASRRAFRLLHVTAASSSEPGR